MKEQYKRHQRHQKHENSHNNSQSSNESQNPFTKFQQWFISFFGAEFLPNIILVVTPGLIFIALYQGGNVGYWIYTHHKMLNKWGHANAVVTDLKVVKVSVPGEESHRYIPSIEYEYQTENGKYFRSDQFFFLTEMYDTAEKARSVIKKHLKHAMESRERLSKERLQVQQNTLEKSTSGTHLHDTAQRRIQVENEYRTNPKHFLLVRYDPQVKTVSRVENVSNSQIYGAHIDKLWNSIMTRTVLPILVAVPAAFMCRKHASTNVFKYFQLGVLMSIFSFSLGFLYSWKRNQDQFKSYVYNAHLEEQIVEDEL